jgi:hypothetical protein
MQRHLVLLCLCISALAACEFFPESTFDLSPESRLPRWFKVPAGMSRDDLTVTMNYYSWPSGRTATFDLYDSHKHTLSHLHGTLRGLEPTRLSTTGQGAQLSDPSYEVITVNGVTDVIEHRLAESVFYLNDDPIVWKRLGVPAN